MLDQCAHEGHRRLMARCGHPCEPQGSVVLQAVVGGIKGVPRPVLRDLYGDVVQVVRGVRVVSGDGVTYWITPPRSEDDILYHVGRREGVEAPVVHRGQAQAVFALQGKFPVRLQLESQVGDGVRCRHRMPGVFQVGAEAQPQARNPLRSGHGEAVPRTPWLG